MDFKEKIEQFILTEICEDLGLNIQHIQEDQPLIDSGIIDSLGILRLLSFQADVLEPVRKEFLHKAFSSRVIKVGYHYSPLCFRGFA